MTYLLISFFLFFPIYLFPQSSSPSSEIMYNYHVKRGFDEINNNYQFRKSLEYLEKMLFEPNLTSERKSELEERIKVVKERIETFSTLKSNKFPIGPIISRSYENQNRYEPAYKMAIDASMDEVKEILRQVSIREGQITVLFLRDDSVSMSAEEVAFRKLEGVPYYNPLTRENLLEIFKRNITLQDIKNDPSILKNFFQNEPWDIIIILNITNLLENNINENEAFYVVDLYKYYIKEPERIVQIGSMSSTGVTTGSFYKKATRDTLLITFIIIFLLIISLGAVFRKKENMKEIQRKISKLKDEIEFLEYIKGLGISILFIGVGIGFCYGIGLGSEQILGSWNTHVGSLQFQSTVILTALMVLANPVLLLILSKLTDYASMVKKRLYLPILLASFYSGMALYMHFFYELYDAIFPGENHILSIFLMSFATVVNGFVTGETYRELIDLNSKKALYNISKKLENGRINSVTNPLVYKRFTLYFSLILITAFISVSSLDTFFKASAFVSPLLFIFLLLVSLILYYMRNHHQLNVQDVNYNNIDVQLEPPKKIENLKYLLLDPDKIPYTFESDINNDQIIESIKVCFENEGDTIAFYGGKWSGKNRLIREILNDNRFSGRTEFKVECMIEGDNLLPFIEGMRSLPQIQSILENLKLGKGAKKAAGLLSNVFSFIPVAGGLISKFLESDVDLTSKENEKFLEKTLIDTIHNLSKEIKESKSEEGRSIDQLIFIIDNFQSINNKMFELIEKIRERIKDPILSPEKNNIAFLLLVNTDYRTDLFERYEFSTVIPREINFNFHLQGFSIDMAFEYFHQTLNFGKTRKNDDLLEKIIEIYGEKNSRNEYKIFPKYITETLLHEISFISENHSQFVYSGNPLQISITPSIYYEYNKKLDLLRPIERKILEAASIFGNTYNIKEVSYVLGMDPLNVLEEIRLLEKEEEIIIRVTSDGDFKFRKGVYKEAFRRRIVNRIFLEGKKETPFQIFIEYCNRANDYFSNKKNLTLSEKERFANISRFSSSEKIEISLKANLDYSRDVFRIPEFQIKGITALDVIIERISENEEILSHKGKSILEIMEMYGILNEFIRIFSFYFNDFQDYIPTNFSNLKIFLEELNSREDLLINRKEPSLLNDLTLIYFFENPFDPKMVELAKKFNKKSLEYDNKEGDRLWSEFWEAFFLKVDGNINFGKNRDFSEICYGKSIEICSTILKKIEIISDEYWNKNLKSRVYNTIAECNQRLFIIHADNTEYSLNTEKYCELTIEYKKQIHDFTGMAMVYNVRSSFYALQPNGYSKAKADLEECRKLNEKMKNYKGLYYTYLSLSSLDERYKVESSPYKAEAEKIKKINNFFN
jgi:hypothetical protein